MRYALIRIAIECLFGDVAARSLGLTERGLPDNAGLALALDDEKSRVSKGRGVFASRSVTEESWNQSAPDSFARCTGLMPFVVG
jgi:hypothetical protein